jgi:hypothetical protein
MKGCVIMKKVPNAVLRTKNHELRTLNKELRFSCAIFSPESKTPTDQHHFYTGAPVNRPACRTTKSLQHQICTASQIELSPHFAYFIKKEKLNHL